MFFTLPIGHDRTVYGAPWTTFGIIVICTVAAIVSFSVEAAVESDLARAEAQLRAVSAAHPDARVGYRVEGLPRRITEQYFDPYVDDDPRRARGEGDAELDRALRDLVARLNRLPTLRLGYRPADPSLGTMFASMWMHGDIFHLVGNMVFLFVAGTLIESRFRRGGFLGFYVLGGIAATLCHHFVEYRSFMPTVGASGAIAATLGAAFVLHPRTRIRLGYVFFFFFVFRKGTFHVPAWVWIPWWIGWQLLDAVLDSGAPVAYFAHVGGFAFGMAAALLLHRFDWLEPDYDRLGPVERVAPT